MDITQALLLEKALDELIQASADKFIYNQFISEKQKFNFKMESNLKFSAGYDPSSKTFTFKDNDAITSGKLKEEFFHAYQDMFYQGGIAQYKTTGKVNIEFEAKLYADITNTKCCVAFHESTAPKSTKDAYEKWIRSIQEKKTPITTADYQKWLAIYNQYAPPEYTSTQNPHLNTPDALFEIKSLSKCF